MCLSKGTAGATPLRRGTLLNPPLARPVLVFSPSFSLGCTAPALPVGGFRYLGIFFFFFNLRDGAQRLAFSNHFMNF